MALALVEAFLQGSSLALLQHGWYEDEADWASLPNAGNVVYSQTWMTTVADIPSAFLQTPLMTSLVPP